MAVKDHYEDGCCPDCDEIIPDDAVEGDECQNCGHVFWLSQPVDDTGHTFDSMDGDHESALESVYGDSDPPDYDQFEGNEDGGW